MTQTPQTQVDDELASPPRVDPDGRLRGGASVDRYRILERLGRGGMSEVYAAYDPRLDRSVAVKIMKHERGHEAHARLQSEARAMARLGHRNVVVVHDVGVFGDELFVAMEHVHGETLAAWMLGDRTWQEIARAFVQAAHALVAAHAAGVIHRDFKPSNAMVEQEGGRVVVLDFGLARVREAPDGGRIPSPSTSTSSGDSTHSAVGTPGYMAPELLHGDGASEASDQYAFCVSLYEALFGGRPFSGRHLVELLEAMRRGPPTPNDDRGVPSWLAAMVQRGLAPDPDDRFASMEALVQTLEQGLAPPRRRGRGIAWAAVGLSAAGLGAWAWSEPQRRCASAGATEIEEVWSTSKRDEVDAAMRQSGRPHAQQTTPRVLARIDRFASSWVVTAQDACRRQPDSTTAMIRGATRCLEDARAQLAVTVETLRGATPEVTDHALDLALALPAVQPCLSASATRTRSADDEAAATLIARSVAARVTGSIDEALEASEQAVSQTTDADPRLHVDALLERARVHDSKALYDDALADASLALAAATEHELARPQARASLELVRIVGDRLRRFDEAQRWAALAEAAVARLPSEDALHTRLSWVRGTVRWRAGDLDEARASLSAAASGFESADAQAELAGVLTELGLVLDEAGESDAGASTLQRALDLRREVFGQTHPSVADALADLAVVAGRAERTDEALKLGRQALAIYTEHVDPQHPHVATIAMNIGLELRTQGAYEEALAAFDRAEAIRREVFGDDHLLVAAVLGNRGPAAMGLGQLDDARRDLSKALAILEKAHGEDHRALLGALTNLGNVENEAGNIDDALVLHTRAHAIALDSLGAEHPAVGVGAQNLGDLLAQRERCDDARPYFERALAIFEANGGAQTTDAAYPLTSLGQCAIDQGRGDEAVPLLERALEIRSNRATPPEELGKTALTLAAAHHAIDPRGEASHRAARRALEAFERAGEAGKDAKTEAQTWIAAHLGESEKSDQAKAPSSSP